MRPPYAYRSEFRRRRAYENRLQAYCEIRPDCELYRLAMKKYEEEKL